MEPLIMAILGVLVGGLVIAMYLPIFQMGSVSNARIISYFIKSNCIICRSWTFKFMHW
jgi:hypothetical protein